MSLFTKGRKRPNPNWYEDGEAGTREQWRQRAFEAENEADRYRHAMLVRGEIVARLADWIEANCEGVQVHREIGMVVT